MKAIYILILLLITTIPVFSNSLVITDYHKTLDFTNKPVVYVQKGNNKLYKQLQFDHSSWKKISLPSSCDEAFPKWNGVCWYRIPIVFPKELPISTVGISLGVISDIDEIYFNGYLIGKTGELKPKRKSAYDRKRIYEISSKYIIPGNKNIIAIKVVGMFKGELGPFKGEFIIAPFKKLHKSYLLEDIWHLIFIVIYFFISLYFCIVFMQSAFDFEYLYFSFFTLATSLYLFLRTQFKYFLYDNFNVLKKIEYFLLFSILILMLEYITKYFRKKRTLIHYIYYAITILSIITLTFSSDIKLWNKILFYVVEPSWIIPIAYAFFISMVEFKTNKDAKYILFSFPIVWIILLNDILVDRGLYDFYMLSNFSFFIIILGTAFLMRKRYMSLYFELESLKAKKSKVSVTDDTVKKIESVIAYLKENFKEELSREGLAAKVDMHYDYFGKLFKVYTGKKINDYINELRVQYAAELLIINKMSVTEIAFDSGFESLSTFYRIFQKLLGVSPKHYKEIQDKTDDKGMV